MTTLAAWAGVDSRGVASLYLVSDSRFTHAISGKTHTNQGQKIYACSNEPHLFGYCGWVYFPSQASASLVRKIDDAVFFSARDNLEARQEKVEDLLRRELDALLKRPEGRYASPFSLIHAAREGRGLTARFRLWLMHWSPHCDWRVRSIGMPTHSKLLYEDGSGATALLVEHTNWQRSTVGKTSRAVFSAFCDALAAGKDSYSGGAPQLAGLFRQFGGKYFGVVYKDQRFFKGKETLENALPENVEWFNAAFERADPATMRRLDFAQRQPRPWRSTTGPRHLP
jgi:hypothetical protein